MNERRLTSFASVPVHLRLLPLVAAASLFYFPAMAAQSASSANSLVAYIGTYTGPKSEGIYLTRFDPATGQFSPPELAAKTVNPTFLALHPNGQFLYAANEVGNFGGRPEGFVSAYAIAAGTGKLTSLNQQSSGGSGPCHLAVDGFGKYLLTANYGSGSIALLPIQADGALGAASAVIQHHGSSVNRQRQEGPHAHFVTTDPANRFVLTCDLGLDEVLVYRLMETETAYGGNKGVEVIGATRGTLVPNDPPSASLKPGAGPRHLAFHPNGRFCFVINEMGSSLTSFAYDAERGALKELQTVSTLPASFTGRSSCAEVQVHPSGKFVFGSNRGHDSIVVFSANADTGKLALVQHQSTLGKTPRHFTVDPTGNWLIAENQDSDNIVVFRLDPATGRLTSTGNEIKVGAPVCLVFLTPKGS